MADVNFLGPTGAGTAATAAAAARAANEAAMRPYPMQVDPGGGHTLDDMISYLVYHIIYYEALYII